MKESKLLIDGHAHLHGCFDSTSALIHAQRNFASLARSLQLFGSVTGCLLCADLQNRSAEQILENLDSAALRCEGTSESHETYSRVLIDPASLKKLVLVFGYQLVAREKVEVLAFGLDDSIPDGLPIQETVELATAQDALVVIPWGFGKWWFDRGKILKKLIETWNRYTDPEKLVFVGDNGGRPAGSITPRLIKTAERLNIWNLPGSDPLPLKNHESRIGRTGFVLPAPVDFQRPLEAIKTTLRAAKQQLLVFGQGQPWKNFVQSQIGLRMCKPGRP